jgi:uncharacterized protein (DUF1499 family)
MARYVLIFLLATAIVALLLLIAGQAGLLRGKQPEDIGFKEGKLKRPSKTPNSVTSQAALWPEHPQQAYSSIAPIRITGDGSLEMAQIVATLKAMPRTAIVQQTPDYIYAQCSTQLLKFTDDVEFALDRSAGVIHVRSASRLGQKDFGVNRQRIDTITKLINPS